MQEAFESFKSEDATALVDELQLARWLDVQGLEPGVPLDVRRISGGLSNESLGLVRGDQRWVLRRPARVALEGSDRGMQREFRVLSALEGTRVPHPRPLALCDDRTVAGCVFYVMEYVDGFVPNAGLPDTFVTDAGHAEIALACMEALGELARVDWRQRGLEDFGRPDGFHERQVQRWSRQLESYQARDLSGLREVGLWLETHRPADDAWAPAIMHGDYHHANVLIAPEPPGRVAAILDWENTTIGDPALDLATFLRLLESTDRGGWAPRDEMIARWEAHSGRIAPDLRYYTALSCFRLSVLLEGVYQRSLADPTRGRSDAMGEMVLRLVGEAEQAIRS